MRLTPVHTKGKEQLQLQKSMKQNTMHRHNTEPAGLPNRNLCKQHTETNIETDKQSVRSQYVQPTQLHAQNDHDDTNNKSNVPTKNAKIHV